MREPSIPLVELREYRSAVGSTYFAGYLGKARIVMLRDDRAECTGKEVARWSVLIQAAQPRPSETSKPTQKTGTAQPRHLKSRAQRPDAAYAAASVRRAAALMVDMGLNPSGSDPNDDLLF